MKHLIARDLFNFKPTLFPFDVDLSLDYWEKTENGYSLSLDIPGVKKEDIKLSVNNGILTVSGERKNKHSSYTYKSSYSVPKNINVDSLKAEYEDGVLTLSATQSESSKEKLIPIK
jgi:HSP20 family protein